MFNLIKTNILVAILFITTISVFGQATNQISLEQTPGKFTTESITVAPGDYQFEIVNNGVDHEVGFVLAPKGKTDQANHIKEAYVKETVKNGSSSPTNIVSLSAGEYVYFCPLNPTEQYNLTVDASIKTLQLEQTVGKFTTDGLTVTPGKYQFSIANTNVDHEVGFVLVPKGKSAPEDHIKEAYVSAPVKTGTSSLTGVVSLSAGEYEYFCPLNPTEKYPLTVK